MLFDFPAGRERPESPWSDPIDRLRLSETSARSRHSPSHPAHQTKDGAVRRQERGRNRASRHSVKPLPSVTTATIRNTTLTAGFYRSVYNSVALKDDLNNKKSGNDNLRLWTLDSGLWTLDSAGWQGWQSMTSQAMPRPSGQRTPGDHDGTYGEADSQ